MAGLTLARQLRQARNDLSIAIVEHRQFPMPEAAHKVGESSVEIAAHYLSEVLDLREHLETEHLPKFGLRLFLRGETPIADDLSHYDEIGVSRVLPVPTYQLDRGRLENHLAEEALRTGIDIYDASTVRRVELGKQDHAITLRHNQQEVELRARYVVDTTGRRAWLRQQEQIERAVRHDNHAVWCRVPGDVDLDRLSSDPAWLQRCAGTPRRLSTNHFSGPGYWLWLIPLASGFTSVGLVFDPKRVALDEVNSYSGLMTWLRGEHPLIEYQLTDVEPVDFHVMQNYARGSRKMFDPDGWMISGDAGMFADPFYSPGADFIAFANLFITDIIVNDKPAASYRQHEKHFMSFFSNTLSLYKAQYGGFGDRNMMFIKTTWDYSYYWGPLAKLFFTQRCIDEKFMQSHGEDLFAAAKLNTAMQQQFRKMARSARRVGGQGIFYDHHCLDYFHQLKDELLLQDHAMVGAQLKASVQRLQAIAQQLGEEITRAAAGGEISTPAKLNQMAAFS